MLQERKYILITCCGKTTSEESRYLDHESIQNLQKIGQDLTELFPKKPVAKDFQIFYGNKTQLRTAKAILCGLCDSSRMYTNKDLDTLIGVCYEKIQSRFLYSCKIPTNADASKLIEPARCYLCDVLNQVLDKKNNKRLALIASEPNVVSTLFSTLLLSTNFKNINIKDFGDEFCCEDYFLISINPDFSEKKPLVSLIRKNQNYNLDLLVGSMIYSAQNTESVN